MAYESGREYLNLKELKLQTHLQSLTLKSQIFQCLTFHINGYTGDRGSMIEMKEIISTNGGNVKTYMSASVDFLVSEEMSVSKWNAVGKRTKVVGPDYVWDCVEMGRLIECDPYLVGNTGKRFGFEAYEEEAGLSDLDDDDVDLDDDDGDDHDEEMGQETRQKSKRGELDLEDPKIKSLLATNPDFIHNYFATSRLHHLSTWKTKLLAQMDEEMTRSGKKGKKPTSSKPRIIMHVDMDCFFASVALRYLDPSLQNRPVVVAHATNSSTSFSSTSEIASCNYVAREKGVKNGTYLKDAKSKCPDLVVLPYDYPQIQECTKHLYDTLDTNSGFVQAVSCDEALIDVTDQISSTTSIEEACLEHADRIRAQIYTKTKCTASIGCAFNPLTARIATFSAKPNGSSFLTTIPPSLPLSKIPGIGMFFVLLLMVGRHTVDKFKRVGVEDVEQASLLDLTQLQNIIGSKTGTYLFNACRGIDETILENKQRTSVSLEINWGIRFTHPQQVREFVERCVLYLMNERAGKGVRYTMLTVKAKERNYEGEPSKFLGCGHCIDHSKSYISPTPYVSVDHLCRDVGRLFEEMQIDATELRGFGVTLKPKLNVLENGQRLLTFEGVRPAVAGKEYVFVSPRKGDALKLKKETFFSPVKKRKRDAYVEFRETYGVNPSQVDQDVLSAMPSDVLTKLEQAGFHHLPPPKEEGKEWGESDVLPSISQIDPGVLDLLPLDIQIEQKAIAAAKRKHKNDPIAVDEPVVTRRQCPNLAGETDPTLILDYIMEWTNDLTIDVCEQDVTYMTTYLTSLARDLQMEQCTRILKYLATRVGLNRKGKSSGCWADAVWRMWREVDGVVVEVYGCALHESCVF